MGRAVVDQPYVTQGSWVRPGGVVVERSFAEELDVQVGDRVTLNGRSFPVVGIAVTAAVPAYPYTVTGVALDTLPAVWSQALGLIWTTEPTARTLATSSVPLSYMLNLKLVDPSQASAFVEAHAGDHRLYLKPWQRVSEVESQATVPFQRGLLIGSGLLDLLAIASLAVIVGGRLAERTRRVGLLKAVGATPRLVAGVLLLKYLALALVGATVGLVIGWLAAPLIANPGAGLVGSVGAPPVTVADVGWIVALAVAVAGLAAWIPSVRAARTSTTATLAGAAPHPEAPTAPGSGGVGISGAAAARAAPGGPPAPSDDPDAGERDDHHDHDRRRAGDPRPRRSGPAGPTLVVRHSDQPEHPQHGHRAARPHRRARLPLDRQRRRHHLGDLGGLATASRRGPSAGRDDPPAERRLVDGSVDSLPAGRDRRYPIGAAPGQGDRPWVEFHRSVGALAGRRVPRCPGGLSAPSR